MSYDTTALMLMLGFLALVFAIAIAALHVCEKQQLEKVERLLQHVIEAQEKQEGNQE